MAPLHLLFYSIIFFISLLVLFKTIFSFKNKTKSRLPPSPISLPIIGHMHLIDTVPYESFHKLATRYGPLIYLRLGSIPCIVASTPQLAKEFLMTNELNFASRPISIAIDYITYNSSGFSFSSYGARWKFMKKVLMTELLSSPAVAKRVHIRKEEIRRLILSLVMKSRNGETVNISEELIIVSNNIVTQMMLGIRYSERKDQAEKVRTLIREVTEIFGQFNISDTLGFLKQLDLQGFLKKSIDIRKRCDVLLERIIHEREEARKKNEKTTSDGGGGEQVKNFLDILLDVSEDKKSEIKLTRDNIKAFLWDVMTAGTDTTASSAEWALGELINHPHILEKAREEIDLVVGKNRLVEESDLPNLPYLQAIYKETLRLHPVVPLLARESIQPCNVGGYDIPAKTSFFVNVWSINRNPKYWKNPLEYQPERFMTSNSSITPPKDGQGHEGASEDWTSQNKDVKGQHFDLLPFGTGRRGCPGISLTLLQAPFALAAIIQCFNWELVGNDNNTVIDMKGRPGLTVPKATPILLALSPRLDVLAE